VLSKLELNAYEDTLVETLSGGWRKRVALARELVKKPDILLLDEPTNHLDIKSILWLESFLVKSAYAAVIVTHDRLFLQRTTNRILELDRRNPDGLLNVRGDYATYLERKEALIDLQRRHERELKNTLRRETEWLRQGAKARTTKQQARINAAEVLKEEVETLETRNETKTTRIDFQSSHKKPKRLIEAQKISKAYGERSLFRNLDLFLGPGSRVGLLGANGCGKSTLIRILLEKEEPDSGKVLRSEHLKVAYFEQNRETLDPTQTLRKTICPQGDHVNFQGRMVHIKGYLDRFLFRAEQMDMPIKNLSGGEQSRILIAKLMLQEANVLVLDEPTNDLDVETLDVLEQCLVQFNGAVLLVTHDRYFLDQVAREIYAFPHTPEEGNKVIVFSGLHQWEEWIRSRPSPERESGKKEKNLSASPDKKRKLGFNETRELAGMEEAIQKTEALLTRLQNESLLPDNLSNSNKLRELYEQIAKTQDEIDRLYSRWAELSSS
jgi:ATP-binding cassette subfamily F protein uup